VQGIYKELVRYLVNKIKVKVVRFMDMGVNRLLVATV
jgi:hypothetical protein